MPFDALVGLEVTALQGGEGNSLSQTLLSDHLDVVLLMVEEGPELLEGIEFDFQFVELLKDDLVHFQLYAFLSSLG